MRRGCEVSAHLCVWSPIPKTVSVYTGVKKLKNYLDN